MRQLAFRGSRSRPRAHAVLACLCTTLAGCSDPIAVSLTPGAGAARSTATAPFTLVVRRDTTPIADLPGGIIALRAGSSSGPVSLRVVASADWRGPATIRVAGLREGVRISAPYGWTLGPDAEATFEVSVDRNAEAGEYPLTLRATVGADRVDVVVPISVVPAVWTYEEPTRLVLERVESGDTSRLVLDKRRGGAIVEASLNGRNFLSAVDNAGGVQTRIFSADAVDDCLGCTGLYRWSAFQGGTQSNAPNPVTAWRRDSAGLYTAAGGAQWIAPADWRGNPVVATSVRVEQWVTALPTGEAGFELRYRISYDSPFAKGAPARTHDLPSVRVDSSLTRVLRYGGGSPWTGASVDEALPSPGARSQRVVAAERWVALVDEKDQGVTLYAPSAQRQLEVRQEPLGGRVGAPTALAASLTTAFPLVPYARTEVRAYLFLGDWRDARRQAAAVRPQAERLSPDVSPPWGYLDRPTADTTLRGVVDASGWALDDRAVARVELLVDSTVVSTVGLTLDRPDLQRGVPWAPLRSGWQARWDTSRFPDGWHTVTARAVDSAGNTTVLFQPTRVAVANQGAVGAPPTATTAPQFTVTLGTEETVFRWRTEACTPYHLPDLPARMMRQADGSVVLFATNAPLNYAFRGRTPAELRPDCAPVLTAADDDWPETFRNQEWIAAVYREGTTVHALIHNEYHDPFAAKCKAGDKTPANGCWYNSITYAASSDDARSFVAPAAPATSSRRRRSAGIRRWARCRGATARRPTSSATPTGTTTR